MENQVEKKQESPLARLTNELNSVSWKSYIEKNVTKDTKGFTNALLTLANQNEMLANCSTKSIVFSAMKAVVLNLPLDSNLGFAYVLPYKKKDGTADAQFQLGYKGFVQLAIRSGQFKTINSVEVCDGEVKCVNKFTGEYEFGEKKSDKVVGYIAYFKLLNGFEKYLYMSVEEMQKHAKAYSQMAKYGKGLWANEDTFGSMAKKTCLKLLLSKYAPLSIEMQTAIEFDQKVFDTNDENGRYADNPQNQSLLENDDDETEEAVIVDEKPKNEKKQAPSEEEINRNKALEYVRNSISIDSLDEIVKTNITLLQTDNEFIESVNKRRAELEKHSGNKENNLNL
jgi:recombination protein RecT